MNIRQGNQFSCDNLDLGFFENNVSYDLDGSIFRKYIHKTLADGRGNLSEAIDGLIVFARKYFKTYPMQRNMLLELYLITQQNWGFSHQTREVAGMYVEASDKILEIGMSKYGLPPMFESYWALADRIGELVDQTAYVHFMRMLNKQPQKPVMCILKNTKVANQAFLPYLMDNFNIISDPEEVSYTRKLHPISPFATFFYKYSDTQYGHNSTFLGSVHQELVDKNIDTSAFALKDVTIEPAETFLKSYGLKEADEFVVLHLREAGYVDGGQHLFRNSNPLDYVEAIEWLLSQGLKVVRIGHSNMMPLPEMNGLIDLTSVERPGEVDIYLCARAKFYYGTASGPVSLSLNFGTSVLVSNSINYQLNYPNSLMQILPYYDPSQKRNLSVAEIEGLGLSEIESSKPFLNRGLEPQFHKSEAHVRSVKEMIEFIDGGDICRSNKDMKIKTGRHDLLTCFTSDTLDLYQGTS